LRLKYDHPAPTVSVKWKSPDAKTFTSRKSAWEHARHLSLQEVRIDRDIYGIGASGKLLKEFVPTLKTTMEVGKLRFVRDGLWVVGQELAWQADRPRELKQQEAEEAEKVHTTGLQLYLATNRNSYRDENLGENSKRLTLTEADKALRRKWRCLSPNEQEIWNDKVQEQFGDDDNDDDDDSSPSLQDEISHLQYFVQQRRQTYRYEQQIKMDNNNGRLFTLAQADRELRKQWREMDVKEQDDWIAKLEMEGEKTTEKVDCFFSGEKMVLKKEEEGKDNTASSTCNDDDEEELIQQTVGKEECDSNEKDQVQKDNIIREPIGTNAMNSVTTESSPASNEQGTKISNRTAAAYVKKYSSTNKKHKVADSSEIDFESTGTNASSEKAYTKNNNVTTKKRAKKRKPKEGKLKWCLQQKQMDLCHDACQEHYEAVIRTVKARDLARELADGFDLLRERGRGRFDMVIPAFDTASFDFLNNFDKTPWMPIVRAILGDDVILIHKGCFISLPGADTQVYHQDGVHLTTQSQRPCHAINVFVPLVDFHTRNGPTEFVLGSHVLGHEGYDRDFLCTPKPTAGTPIIFDYRLGHRGLGNSSHYSRPVVYCTYARASDGKEFRDSVNFSRKRYHKIGELSAKPLSREERRNKRKRSIESLQEKKEIEKAKKLSTMIVVENDDSGTSFNELANIIKPPNVDKNGDTNKTVANGDGGGVGVGDGECGTDDNGDDEGGVGHVSIGGSGDGGSSRDDGDNGGDEEVRGYVDGGGSGGGGDNGCNDEVDGHVDGENGDNEDVDGHVVCGSSGGGGNNRYNGGNSERQKPWIKDNKTGLLDQEVLVFNGKDPKYSIIQHGGSNFGIV